MNRSIAYTSNWFHTFLLSCILAIAVVFILIFLQPFDSYGDSDPYLQLKLAGYGICFIIPIMLIHFLEEAWFRLTSGKWYLYQEITMLALGLFIILVFCFFYNVFVVNDIPLQQHHIYGWISNYGLPFIPIILPLWAYLRFRFSKITIEESEGKPKRRYKLREIV